MIRRELAEILKKTLGLNISSIGAYTLQRSINRRVNDLGLSDQEEYVRYVRRNRSEINRLIDEVVIPETWFFRDTVPFVALRDIVGLWHSRHPQKTLRILSIPCASGEEPYSIAITMLEAGWTKKSFSLDGVDVSSKIIERAIRATYTKNSFRNTDLSFRDKYFTRTGNSFTLDRDIVSNVNFHLGNILDPAFMAGFRLYDIIFCRNILFYFDLHAQQVAVHKLARLLQPDGYLFVGAAEAIRYLSEGFVPLEHDYGLTTILHYGDNPAGRDLPSTGKSAAPAKKQKDDAPSGTRQPVGHETPEKVENDAPSMLDKARQFADEGRLDEAKAICHAVLQNQGPMGDVYYLLAILHDFSGELSEAVKLLKKALYLLPYHKESLILLIYLSERLGDKKAVTNYKRRLERVGKKLGRETAL